MHGLQGLSQLFVVVRIGLPAGRLSFSLKNYSQNSPAAAK